MSQTQSAIDTASAQDPRHIFVSYSHADAKWLQDIDFWIAVSHCLYSASPLAAYQCLNDPARPLDSLRRSKRNAELVRIAKQIGDLS